MQNRTKNQSSINKRDLRASGLSLLPLALRPLLLSIQRFIRSNSIQNPNSNSNLDLNSNSNSNSKTTRFCLSSATSFLFALFGIFILQNSYTNSVSAKSITLTIPSEALNLSVSPGSGSVFKKSSPGIISVSTDSSRGYSLSIQSKTSSDLLNGLNKIVSIKSPLSESDYESSGDVNTWGYLPSKLGGTINTDFQPGPTTEPTTLDKTETSSEGTDYNIALATKIDDTLPAGNYSNTFVLSATTNDSPYDDIMQNWSGCEDLPKETQTLNLLDTRDNKIYTVAKLADGQCWMTENLAIGKDNEETKLNPNDSDVAKEFTLSKNMENPNKSNAYDSNEIHIDSTYGGYYSWYAATAGEGTQSISKDGTNVEHSICPKGWRLPTKQDFSDLDKALGGTGSYQSIVEAQVAKYTGVPNNFLMGGYYGSGNSISAGSSAYYWSSTAGDANSAYFLYFGSSHVYPQNTGNKSGLFSVRCVSRPDNPKKIGTMQTVEEWGDNVKEGETYLSEDVRDNKQYTVARLADGRLWMTKNLEIGKTDSEIKLTSDTSDTAGDFTLLASSDSPNANNAYDSREIHLDPTYGGYYTWYTATAGEGTQYVSTNGQNVEHSICPKGWRLPTKQDFIDLDKALGGTGSIQSNVASQVAKYTGAPNNFLMGGYYTSGSSNLAGSYAYYWSSTAANANDAYYLILYSSNVDPQSNGSKNLLFSVRCVSRTDSDVVGTMQTVDQWGDDVEQGQTVRANDTRDNNIYSVARLADGKLWMTRNLRIQNKTLTTSDSDVASNFQIPASTDNPNSSNSYTSKELHVDSVYGGYYTWYTATAGEGTQSISTDEQNMTHSICPKGWRLPTKQDFIDLDKAFGGTGENSQLSSTDVGGGKTLLQMYQEAPAKFLMGGSYYGFSYSIDVGSYALYWSSTAVSANSAYRLYFTSSRVLPQHEYIKSNLFSVRCIARNDLSKADNLVMQNVNEWGVDVTSGQTVKAKDSRDNKEYTVARLKDGKLWMTKNLEIENYNLTPDDSDVASAFELPASTDKPNVNYSYESKELHVDEQYGGYYTWYTATAGEGTQDVSTNGQNVEHSICPKGWRLPTKDEFVALDKALGGTGENGQSGTTQPNKYMGSPNNFLMGGSYSSGSPNAVGSYAYYWSSTAYDARTAYGLSFLSSYVSPQRNYSKGDLFSVRCVSRQ